jgi:ATP-dependent metalloprotease
LNREYNFEETVRLYEIDKEPKSKLARAQYIYAKSHLELIESNKSALRPGTIHGTKENPVLLYFRSFSKSKLPFFIPLFFFGIGLALVSFISKKRNQFTPEKPTTTFQDVKGLDECLSEFEEIVKILKNPQKYRDIGAKLPRGILLTGEPGTGKTLMARAIAGESQVDFFYTSGSEFDEIFVGVGAKRVRELFEAAKKSPKSIIFIDEIDSIGRSRKGLYSNYHRQTLNQLLVEMDGFDTSDNVIVIAATNMPQSIDEALMRPGRFDKSINVPVPSLKSRIEIISLYLNKIKIDSTVNSEKLAKSTFGMTGADIANLINTAMQLALKDGRNTCTSQDIENAKDRLLLGIASKSPDETNTERFSKSLYEAGKVVTILNTKGADPLYKTTIIKRGQNLGKTTQTPDKDKLGANKMEVLAMIDTKMAGKVIHDLQYGDIKKNTHSQKDIIEATEFVKRMVREGLFDEFFGVAFFEDQESLGPKLKDAVDQAAKKILQESYDRVEKLLISKSEDIKKITRILMERETLSRDEILEIIRND